MIAQLHFKASMANLFVLVVGLVVVPTCFAKNKEHSVLSVEVTAHAHHARVQRDSKTTNRYNGTLAVDNSSLFKSFDSLAPSPSVLEALIPGVHEFKEALKKASKSFNGGKCADAPEEVAYYGCGGALGKVCDCPMYPIRICYEPYLSRAGEEGVDGYKAALAGRCDIHWWIYVAAAVAVLLLFCCLAMCMCCCQRRKRPDDIDDDYVGGHFEPGGQYGPPHDQQWGNQAQWDQSQQAQSWSQPQPQFGQPLQPQSYFAAQAGQSFQPQSRVGQPPQWGSQPRI